MAFCLVLTGFQFSQQFGGCVQINFRRFNCTMSQDLGKLVNIAQVILEEPHRECMSQAVRGYRVWQTAGFPGPSEKLVDAHRVAILKEQFTSTGAGSGAKIINGFKTK